MNISPQVQVRQTVEIGGKGGEANNMFYNAALMDKINDKQNEFDQLFAEYKQRRPDGPLKGGR